MAAKPRNRRVVKDEPGRPTLCTPEAAERICAAIRAGATFGIACGAVGITRPTLADWRRRGADGEEPYAEFSAMLQRAHEEGMLRLAAIVAQAAPQDWKAAAWLLDRRQRDEYGKTVTVDIAQSSGAAALLEKLTAGGPEGS